MRIFVCEYVTGGGLSGAPLPPGLAREGDLMLRALVNDLAALPGLNLVTTRDVRMLAPNLTTGDLACEVERVNVAADPWPIWRRLTEHGDALWPIAPESDGLLERLSRLATESGRLLLGSSLDAVRLTASKRATAAYLASRGIPTVSCGSAEAPPDSLRGWVVKPDDGAGCEDTFLLGSAEALARWRDVTADPERFVVQPFVPGPPVSLSLLCCGGRATVLSYNRQVVTCEAGRFRFQGVEVGGHGAQRERYQHFAADIVAALPGLWGYVGVDLIESEQGPLVLEVNPRLTTSYAGLAPLLGCNPAALVLDLLQDAMPRVPIVIGDRAVSVMPAHA